ncbi:unnamed protein product, partial [Rotaria sordida]
RLNHLIYIKLPNDQSRVDIIMGVLRQLPSRFRPFYWTWVAAVNYIDSILLASETTGFSGAMLTEFCQHAYKFAKRESIKKKQRRIRQTTTGNDKPTPVLEMRRNHFTKASDLARRSVNASDIPQYEIFAKTLPKHFQGVSTE